MTHEEKKEKKNPFAISTIVLLRHRFMEIQSFIIQMEFEITDL